MGSAARANAAAGTRRRRGGVDCEAAAGHAPAREAARRYAGAPGRGGPALGRTGLRGGSGCCATWRSAIGAEAVARRSDVSGRPDLVRRREKGIFLGFRP